MHLFYDSAFENVVITMEEWKECQIIAADEAFCRMIEGQDIIVSSGNGT